jgi:hypothetical protein
MCMCEVASEAAWLVRGSSGSGCTSSAMRCAPSSLGCGGYLGRMRPQIAYHGFQDLR